MLQHAAAPPVISNSINIQHYNTSLLSFAATSPGDVAGSTQSLLGGLVGSCSILASCQAQEAIRLCEDGSEVERACPCVCLYLVLNYNTLILLCDTVSDCHECKHRLLLAGGPIVAGGLKNSNGLNGCGVFVEPEFRMCCSELFVQRFPRLPFSSLSLHLPHASFLVLVEMKLSE